MSKTTNLIAKLFFIALSYMAEIKHLFHVMIALVFIDLITGIWKSVKASGWRSIKSRTLKRSVIKVTAYTLAIISTYIIEKEIILTGIYISRIVVGLICMVEIASIFENLAEITGDNVFLKIFETLKTYFNTNKDIINKIDTKKQNDEPTS